MKTAWHVRIAIVFLSLAAFAGLILKTQSQTSRPEPRTATDQISRGTFFGQRIVPVGMPPAEAESQSLLVLLQVAAASDYQPGVED